MPLSSALRIRRPDITEAPFYGDPTWLMLRGWRIVRSP
jgi:hypothetical protein